MQKSLIVSVIILLSLFHGNSQHIDSLSKEKQWFVGSTLFVLGNLDTRNSPDFFQINVGHRFNERYSISLELKTWKYAWPLGIPYGPSFEGEGLGFPGFIREYGFALCYQRFWWKGLYTSIHMMPAWQRFVHEEFGHIDSGFQLFNTYRFGYQFRFFSQRFFIEPSIAITHRPFHTEMPESYNSVDEPWSKWFFGEPGLHFGYNF